MERFNPWWRAEPDSSLEAWEKLPAKWIPHEIEQISLKPFSLNFLSGPRQVGKTTLVKLLINKLTKQNHADSRSVFYLSCDEVSDYKEMGEILDSYLKARSSWGIESSYIFLDEVTFVDEWWRAVKMRIDSRALSSDVVTVTGSASLDLLRQKEYFPGRRGNGKDIMLRPLGFRSYASAMSKGLTLLPARRLEETRKAVDGNLMHAESLAELFESYLETGGFPLAIREKIETKRVGEDGAKKSLLEGIRGDFQRAGKSEKFMKEVVRYLLLARGTPISWLSISKETSMGSPHTASSYVETLEDLLLARSLELMRPDGQVVHRKNKKVHFGDPLLYSTLGRYAGIEPEESAVVEGTVAMHLARAYSVYYWRNGSEVDVLALEEGGPKSVSGIVRQFGFEVKWGFKKGTKPKHIRQENYYTLDRKTVPVFLSSLSFA